MSIYSITENSIIKPSPSDYLNFQRLTKFNKFYLSKNNFSSKFHQIYPSSNNNKNNKKNIVLLDTTLSPIKMTKAKSQIYLNNSRHLNSSRKIYKKYFNVSNNSARIKTQFNPDILDAHFISKPKKLKKKKINIDVPIYNTFLSKKIKNKSLRLNTYDLININNSKFITSMFMNKPIVYRSIKDIQVKKIINYNKNDSVSNSMKNLIEKNTKGNNKNSVDFMVNKFKKRLIYDKKENLKEYNKFMFDLRTNLSKSKSKNNFFY